MGDTTPAPPTAVAAPSLLLYNFKSLNGAAPPFCGTSIRQPPLLPYVWRSRTPIGPSTREYERARESLEDFRALVRRLPLLPYVRRSRTPIGPSTRGVREGTREYERVRETLTDSHCYHTFGDAGQSGPSTRGVREQMVRFGLVGRLPLCTCIRAPGCDGAECPRSAR